MSTITATIISACAKGASDEYTLEQKMVAMFVAPSDEHPGFFDVLVFLPHPSHRPELSKHEVLHLRKPVAAKWLLASIEKVTDGRVRRDTSGWKIALPGTFSRLLEAAGGA